MANAKADGTIVNYDRTTRKFADFARVKKKTTIPFGLSTEDSTVLSDILTVLTPCLNVATSMRVYSQQEE